MPISSVTSAVRRVENRSPKRATRTPDDVTATRAWALAVLPLSTTFREYWPLRLTVESAVTVPPVVVTPENAPEPVVETTPCSIPDSQSALGRVQATAATDTELPLLPVVAENGACTGLSAAQQSTSRHANS